MATPSASAVRLRHCLIPHRAQGLSLKDEQVHLVPVGDQSLAGTR
ncbi:hypothetical protein [Streptomyces sp. NPDC101181]